LSLDTTNVNCGTTSSAALSTFHTARECYFLTHTSRYEREQFSIIKTHNLHCRKSSFSQQSDWLRTWRGGIRF